MKYSYLQATEILKVIEKEFDVDSIKYKKISVWPVIRIYLHQALLKGSFIPKIPLRRRLSIVVRGIFFYNPFVLFKHYNVWVFNGCERRKKIGDKYIHRISGDLTEGEDVLDIEKPCLYDDYVHHKRQNINEKNIISEALLLCITHIIRNVFLRFYVIKIENKCTLSQICNKYDIKDHISTFLKNCIAQKIATDILILLLGKPKKVFIECPYSVLGYVWCLKSKNIKVIELQHGVLNSEHYAYNTILPSKLFYPDQIYVFGEIEEKFLLSEHTNYCKNIYKKGQYILQFSNSYFIEDIFAQYRDKYSEIIVVASQSGIEKYLQDFIRNLCLRTNYLFVYIPRYKQEENTLQGLDNLMYIQGENIYQYLKWCDIHLTVSSSTCLEAQYFNKPTILYNINNLSKRYYKNLLNEENGVFYVENVSEFVKAMVEISRSMGHYQYKNLFYRQ